jgi:hypothetical protein
MIKGLKLLDFYTYSRRNRAYVYAYLRRTDGTPYYIGVASNGYRPVDKKHVAAVPDDRRRIRVLRHNLTKSQALLWERFYIAKYGRKDTGTGILRNLSDGGEGNYGYKHKEDTKQAIGSKIRGRRQSPEWVEARASRIRGENNGMYGRSHSAEARAKMSASRTGKKRGPMSEEQKRKLSAARKGVLASKPYKRRTPEQVEAHRLRLLEWHRKDRTRRAAARGVQVEELLLLEKRERNARSYATWKLKQEQLAS